MELKKKMLGLCSFERTIARQRSRIKWLQEGDANTRFFHLHANHRRRVNYIASLKVAGSWVSTQKDIEEAFHNHFVRLIGTPVARCYSLDFNFLGVPTHDLHCLNADFNENEVWEAIRSLPSEKAPGPDGFINLFYQQCWELIKTDIMAAFHALGRLASSNFRLLNQALLTLLPKKLGA